MYTKVYLVSKKDDCGEPFLFLNLDYSYYYSGYYQGAAEPMANTATEIQETSDMYPGTTETSSASLQQSDEVNNMANTEVKRVYVQFAVSVSNNAVILSHT